MGVNMGSAVIFGLIVFGILILGFWLWSYIWGGFRIFHQRIVGLSLLCYGWYLSTLTGSYTALVLPGIGAIGGGALAGGGVGFFTWVIIGTVGVATGGTGIALGALAMSCIGAALGATGAATGGFGIKTINYPLVSPIFWVPLLVLGVYFLIGSLKKKRMLRVQSCPALIE